MRMVRRSTPQSKTDKAAFPVRIRLKIPDLGFGMRLDDIHRWLRTEIGSGQFAVHSSSALGGGGLGIYLLDVECARAFVSAFPDLTLADGTALRPYSSPAHDAGWSGRDLFGVCNLYSMTTAQDAIRQLFEDLQDQTGNLPAMPAIFPDQMAPVVRNGPDGPVLTTMRWGMPSPAFALKNRKTDTGVTNVRNTTSPHWRRWLGVEHRCVVPFTSFCEYDARPGKNKEPVWFALNESRPLAFFAGIWTEWTSVRKLKEGETTNNLFGFLTTDANAVVGPVHPKAMPVVLTNQDELQKWLTAPTAEALELQRPLPGDVLRVVARGERQDEVGIAPTES